jgi:hypothetical protein
MKVYQSSRDTKASLSLDEAATLALRALAYIFSDDQLTERFIALTGLTLETLRTRADQPDVLAAILGFLLSHEPDLIACAANLEVAPARLVQAEAVLAQA